ncbi:MAG: alkaline phosphatase D family protein [Phycisphaerales bacterium]
MHFILAALVLTVPTVRTPPAAPIAPPRVEFRASERLGPFVGHVGPTEATIWSRVDGPGEWVLEIRDEHWKLIDSKRLYAEADHDFTIRATFTGLSPGGSYLALRVPADETDPEGVADELTKKRRYPAAEFRTTLPPDTGRSITLVVGSCQHDDFAKPQPIWERMAALKPDALLLIGDTPYIDTTDLAVQRRRYREFNSIDGLHTLRKKVPAYATWDDHDFGRNDTDGTLKGKENSRRAFREYTANPEPAMQPVNAEVAGPDAFDIGIATSFRLGPAEVFLLDCRWFAGTEPSFADPERKTLLGAAQWNWLKRSLRASTAPFKLLVCGMVWCDEVRPNKKDYWGAYPHERKALFDFLHQERIGGVMLVGGDIHRNRAYRHGRGFSGMDYPLYEVVSSPLGSKVMRQGDGSPKTNPDMLYDGADARTFAVITCDSTAAPAKLTVRWMNDEGRELYRIDTDAEELTPKVSGEDGSGAR